MSDVRFTVLIVDDEPPARRTLREFLSGVHWIREIREAGDGAAAIATIDAWQPDLVFLDIVMPGATGLDVLTRVRHRPHVIFTTAFDQHALTAFELGALDYVLKPFGRDRLMAALERARATLAADPALAIERARVALNDVVTPLARWFVRDGTRIVALDPAEIERIEADDDYAVFHHRGRRYGVRLRLQDLEAKLDPRRFVRVHRSHIVNVAFVAACEPYDAWRLQVVLSTGHRIVASRSGTRLLHALVLG
jgi:two-component system, LytTR family, response regulator